MVKMSVPRSVVIVGAITLLLVPSLLAQGRIESGTATLRHSGRVLSVSKSINLATGEESFSATDLAGRPVDYLAALRVEQAAAAQPAAKLVAPLSQYLEEAAGQPITVGIWLRFDPKALDFRADLQAQVENGVAYDRAKADLLARVEAANAVVVGQARAQLIAMGVPVVSTARFAPIAFVNATAGQVIELAKLESVSGLFADVEFHDTTDDAINTHRWNRVHDFNIRGDGIQVAVLENNGIDDAACVSNILNVIGYNDPVNTNIQDHPTGTASVIGSMSAANPGHARGIQLHSANSVTAGGSPSYNTSNIIAASDWSIGQGADVVNCSFGFDDTPLTLQLIDHYVDYAVRFTTTTFTVAAGNNGGGTNDVSSPAVSWNCIAVGAMNDAATATWADDTMATFSSFDDPTSVHGDREKPELAAEGSSMTMLDLGCSFTYVASGTSFAAPGIAGMCGALMQMSSTLPGWPEVMKAIMMAAASHNIEGSSRLSDKDGAGGINGLQAYRLVDQNKFKIGTFLPTSFNNNGYFTTDIYLQGGDKARVCLVWDSLADGPAAYTGNVLNADLDVSVIRDMPPGRRAIQTTVKPESRRDDVYALMRKQFDEGRQAYVVYPLIEESEKIDLKAATEMADTLAQQVFPEYRVALLHGKMKQDAKDRVMRAFAAGDVHVLVSTTVIEVGIDVPNATVMVIEHAERFGLSQLHQLRGRVGRGGHQSHCALLYQYPISKQGKARLQALADTVDGFEIAERDLQLRGPGDFFGTRQSGLPTLRTGDLLRDHPLMEQARDEAARFLDQHTLTEPLVAQMKAAWPSRFGLMDIG